MVKVKQERRSFPPLYTLKPSQQFSLFEEKLKETVNSLLQKRTTNRALKEVMKRKGWKELKKIEKKFKKFDSYPLEARKVIYNVFYRIFQRLDWALNSGSEREIEIKVWITSSIDYLNKVIKILEDNYG
ncbi:hypothetical protein C7457_0153 [Thermovibrio guaymasensis]|uniref:Uncharacterized protein n=1 Tax=Thermovibrio guaymasensis TaxID=240167 RepID=A0A420W7M0_9BACT|nr:hypothetical protein [Thermovibrio guaymasensis]RKQ63288.1 hypothetical protein C7457_0153 [Thermovibrio guaymasensis]